MKFILEFDCDKAVFDENLHDLADEIGLTVKDVADRIQHGEYLSPRRMEVDDLLSQKHKVIDSFCNSIGYFQLIEQ